MGLLPFANGMLSVLTIIGQIFIVFLILNYFIFKIKVDFLKKNALVFGFVISFISVFGSLFYSEIALFEPCKLCWFQRIFMYPQLILFGLAIWGKDKSKIWAYSFGLSVIGFLIAGFHYFIQISGSSSFCDVTGYSAGCSQNFLLYLGYISIPMMALTAFGMLISFFFLMMKK